MTYCVGVLLDSGMVFASDSRTNAGVDHVSSFRKMAIYERPGDRAITVLSSGNLSLTQSALNMLDRNAKRAGDSLSMWTAESMFEVAGLLGDCLREVKRRDAPYLEQNHIDAHASFIIGGQIKGEIQRLFLVYAEGNFIEATPETPFFQIGETKYGKPIIDRVIKPNLSITEAIKCVLVSFDSTMRSNVSVGLPIDLCCIQKDSLRIDGHRRITETDPYFSMLHHQWGEGLRRVFTQLPEPYWDETKL
ncbi:MAG TPA: proteasome-type protease [Burkholderiales bacterium]|nr:proteasome-type protease [Burkholderiales bacterium]